VDLDVDSFIKSNWRQGAFLPDDLAHELTKELNLAMSVDNGDKLIITSHDCDVNSRNFKDEPYAEVIIARKAELDGNKKMGKSSRFLQLKTDINKEEVYYEMKASDRFSILRTRLLSFSPANYFSPANTVFLSEWLARRYSRAAFPNAFDERISPLKGKIKKCLQSVSGDIFGIYFSLIEDELPKTEPYKTVGFAVMIDEDFCNTAKLDRCKLAITKLQGLLSGVGVEFDEDIEIVSDKEFSLEDLRLTKRWDWDVLSYDEGHQAYLHI
jgi:hypothetical protein